MYTPLEFIELYGITGTYDFARRLCMELAERYPRLIKTILGTDNRRYVVVTI